VVRHAKSAWPDVPDHERPLAPRGRRDAPAMGRWLRAAGHVPGQVLYSTARRARETWKFTQPGLKLRQSSSSVVSTRPRQRSFWT
jgi:phosphohistidine phosphatase